MVGVARQELVKFAYCLFIVAQAQVSQPNQIQAVDVIAQREVVFKDEEVWQ